MGRCRARRAAPHRWIRAPLGQYRPPGAGSGSAGSRRSGVGSVGLALPFAAAPAASFYLCGVKGGISPLPARAWERTGREAGGVSIAVPPGGPDPLRSPPRPGCHVSPALGSGAGGSGELGRCRACRGGAGPPLPGGRGSCARRRHRLGEPQHLTYRLVSRGSSVC